MENQIRELISRNFNSVRRAWLALDDDHDGLIEPAEFIRLMGNSLEMDFRDLEKLMSEHGGHRGTMSYEDFSKWMGAAIQ